MRAMTLLVLAATLGTAACDGENLFRTAGPTLISRTLTFDAVVFQVEDPVGDTVNLVDQGAQFELVLDDDTGTFESRFQHRAITIDMSGTYEVDGGTIVFSDDPFVEDGIVTQRAFTFQDADDVLFLGDPETVWDIDNDGVLEVVSLDIRLERRR